MGLVIHAGQVLEIQAGVDLGSRYIGVAQEFLHGAQVLRGLQQMAGEAVAQAVRVYVYRQPRLGGQVVQLQLHDAWCNACATHAQKKGGLAVLQRVVF